jgi:hypothetical protein
MDKTPMGHIEYKTIFCQMAALEPWVLLKQNPMPMAVKGEFLVDSFIA